MPLPLHTERILLRPFQDSDIEPFAAYRSDPEVAKYQSWETPFSVEEAASFVEALNASLIPATDSQFGPLDAIQREVMGTSVTDWGEGLFVEVKADRLYSFVRYPERF